MRDEQVRRYARHILLPDVGGLGQTALLEASARLELRGADPRAELVACSYLAAGGVGAIVITGASDAQLAVLAAHGPDTTLETSGEGRELTLAPKPAWWPAADGDDTALGFWRGGLAAVRWMADVASR
jgi:hypothetical protein